MMPREITKAIRLAVGSAALAGRTRIIPDDIPAAANEGKSNPDLALIGRSNTAT